MLADCMGAYKKQKHAEGRHRYRRILSRTIGGICDRMPYQSFARRVWYLIFFQFWHGGNFFPVRMPFFMKLSARHYD